MEILTTNHAQIPPLIGEIHRQKDIKFCSMLDVGSGLRTSEKWFRNAQFSTSPKDYCAAETDPEMVKVLQARQIQTIDPMKEDKRSDLVVALEVLEHLLPEDSPDFLKFCERNTQKVFAITVPNFEYWATLKADGEMKECRWVPDHFKDFKPTSNNPHHHKQEMTPTILDDYFRSVFDTARWEYRIYRAWPWRLTDISRDREFFLYFKLFAIAIRK